MSPSAPIHTPPPHFLTGPRRSAAAGDAPPGLPAVAGRAHNGQTGAGGCRAAAALPAHRASHGADVGDCQPVPAAG
eukprot:215616-Chlamydomonas_euryale.AAC.1